MIPRRRPWVPLAVGVMAMAVTASCVAPQDPAVDAPAPTSTSVVPPSEEEPTAVPPGEGAVGVAAPIPCRTVRYTHRSGPARLADLCGQRRPRHRVAIVVIHGGGGTVGNRKSSAGWVRRLHREGYVVLAVDYGLFRPDTSPPVYPRQEREVKAAVQYLRRQAGVLGVDPDRIVAHGISAGAQLGAAALVTPDDPAFDGPGRWPATSDRLAGLIGFYGYYDGYQLEPQAYYGGNPDDEDPAVRDRWRRADSTARAAAASGPALLFHGDRDRLIVVDQSRRFAEALRASGSSVELVVEPDADHGYDRPAGPLSPAGEAAAARAFAWLDRNFG